MMVRKFSRSAVLLSLFSACTSPQADRFDEAMAHADGCGAPLDEALVESRDPESAEAILALSCEELRGAPANDDEKADQVQAWVSVGVVSSYGFSRAISTSGRSIEVRSLATVRNVATVEELVQRDCLASEGQTSSRLRLNPCAARIRNRSNTATVLQYRQRF